MLVRFVRRDLKHDLPDVHDYSLNINLSYFRDLAANLANRMPRQPTNVLPLTLPNAAGTASIRHNWQSQETGVLFRAIQPSSAFQGDE